MNVSSSIAWNDRLRQERIHRNWRQQDLADHLGTTVITIQRWERGSQQPSAYFRVKLCALFGKSSQELGLRPETPQNHQRIQNLPLSHLWQWPEQEGGIIRTEYTIPNTILVAPYYPPTADYAVEAHIQRLGYSGSQGQAYGLVVRMTGDGGYVCGVGIHYPPEHFFLGRLIISNISAPQYQISDIAAPVWSIDTSWHTYRVEVKRIGMTLFYDDKPIQAVEIFSSGEAGKVGLYVDNASINVKGFKLFMLG